MLRWLTLVNLYLTITIHNVICPNQRAKANTGNDIADSIRIRVYSEGINTQHEECLINDAIDLLKRSLDFDSAKPTLMVIHGMSMKADSRLIRAIVDAFGKGGQWKNYNIMSVNFPDLFKNNLDNLYFYGVVAHSEAVGWRIHDLLRQMIKNGLAEADQISLVGNSIGAHVCGYAARPFGKNGIGYIAGLDPAGVGYDTFFDMIPLSSADARVVHIFQTNMFWQATAYHLGTANFIFNGGIFQPGCLLDHYGCSHARAVWYFAESVINSDAFVTRSCSAIAIFSACICNRNEAVKITFPPDISARGNYYLRTKEDSPFGMGEEGSSCAISSYVWLPSG